MALPGFLQLEDLPLQHNEMHRKLFQFTLAVLPKTFSTAPTTDELPPGYVAYYESGSTRRLYLNFFGTLTYAALTNA